MRSKLTVFSGQKYADMQIPGLLSNDEVVLPTKATSTQKSRVCTITRLGVWVLLLLHISSPLPNTQHISRRKCQDRMAVTNGDASACPTPPGEQSVNAHKTLPSPGEVGPEDELYFLNDRARVAEIDGSESQLLLVLDELADVQSEGS